jgi:hypothetical protein
MGARTNLPYRLKLVGVMTLPQDERIDMWDYKGVIVQIYSILVTVLCEHLRLFSVSLCKNASTLQP